MSINRVCTLLQSLVTEQPILPPTELYCEGWLLRIILDWYAAHEAGDDPLAFAGQARWFSEALLPTTFKARWQGDPLAESRSHADGVVGHFTIGGPTKAGLALEPQASYFVVLEAKMFSPLAAGIKNIPSYNQAARSVACMAETLRLAGRPAHEMTRLAFYVLAPRRQIDKGIFKKALDPAQLAAGVQARVQSYDGEKEAWYAEAFAPAWKATTTAALAWEDVIGAIAVQDGVAGEEIGTFYQLCLKYGA